MENEHEGINLETVNSEEDSITLPGVQEEVVDVEDNTNTETKNNLETIPVDEEKENLKKGVNYERKLRKEAEKKVKELESRLTALEEANKKPEKTTLDELVESGVDADIAKSIASAIDKKQSSSTKVEKELADMKFKYELSEKSKDSNFSDILDYEDEIKDLVDKGLSIEQSYYAINYNKSKTSNTKSEIERKVEAKMQNNQARKEILGNINSNAGGAVDDTKGQPKATATEIAMARLAGMDINDYLAAKNAESIKQYDSYLKKKAK